jgi:hypothetical protein
MKIVETADEGCSLTSRSPFYWFARCGGRPDGAFGTAVLGLLLKREWNRLSRAVQKEAVCNGNAFVARIVFL